MKIKLKQLPLTLFLIATSLTFSAYAANINQRQENQQQRILQGVKSGELTAKETAKLKKGQVQLQKMELRAKKDGLVTKKEKARLQTKADKESVRIALNKHDDQKY